MLREAANRLPAIAAALQLDRGRWVWLLLIVLSWWLVLGLGDSGSALLRYDRGAIAAGGWWRLLTAHAVHLNAHHLVLNALGLVLVWSLFASDYLALEWTVIVLCGALAIGSGLWWLSPGVGWYVGSSGVLHAAVAAGTVKHFAERAADRWLACGLLCAKLAYEQLGGREPPLVVVDAHLYGAIAGAAVGAALCARTAIIRHHFRS